MAKDKRIKTRAGTVVVPKPKPAANKREPIAPHGGRVDAGYYPEQSHSRTSAKPGKQKKGKFNIWK